MHHRFSLAFVPFLAFGNAGHAQAPSPQLTAVLSQMDAGSKTFKSATADFQWTFIQKVAGVSDTTQQTGSMYIERTGTAVSFGAKVYDGTAPSGREPSKIIDFEKGTALIYSPAEKQADRFKAGGSQSAFENYLSLGFGGSGHDLTQAWQITDGGPVTLTEAGKSVKTEKLILVSKDPGVRNNFKQVTLWVDPVRDISLKQVFFIFYV